MIDTIGFTIPYSTELVNQIFKSGSNVTYNIDSRNREINYKYMRSDDSFGSFSRSINLFISEKKIKLEFSVPKYIFGHNVYMVYPDEVEMVLYQLWGDLCKVYKAQFPTPDKWKLIRLDICYNWKLPSQEFAQESIDIIKKFSFPKKRNKKVYPTSVMWLGGRNHSIKFYLKQPEYYKHDFKVLKGNPYTIDLAYDLMNVSGGVLRFEATLWSRFLDSKFPQLKGSYHIAKQYDIIVTLLGEFVSSCVNSLDTNFMSLDQARKILVDEYGTVKARNFLRFLQDLTTMEKELFDFYYSDYHRTTIYRMKRDLKNIGLGSYFEFKDDDYRKYLDFSVPSDICTNFPLLSESAEALEGGE